MKSELIWEYECLALMSRTNPLARKETLTLEDLKDSVELSHRDMAVPYIDASRMRNEMTGITKKKYISTSGATSLKSCAAFPTPSSGSPRAGGTAETARPGTAPLRLPGQ